MMDEAQSQSERLRVSAVVSEREVEEKGDGRAPLQQVDVSMVPCGRDDG